jgi:signal transduction histidine kinase
MMEQYKALNVAIVGGGPGCKAIMDMILAEKLSQLRMKLIGVACTNPKAVGYLYAQEKGIYTTRDYRDLYKLKGLNMIIELTGRDEISNEISRTKPDHIRLMRHVAARLFWDVFQIEEKRIAERKQAEEELRESTRRMEIAYDQSVVYAQQLNEEITQRKQAEEALRKAHDELEQRVKERTAELAKTNKELLEYDHIVAHVLKAPLRAIHFYSDFLREDLEGTLNEDQKAYVDGLTRTVRQVAGLVDDLLEFSMVGRRSGPIETIDIGAFLKELISSLDLPSDVEVVMGNEWPTIEAEPALVQETFLHLIRNAVKFNRSPRKCIEIGWLPAGDEHYKLFVRDNGIGIEPRYQEQIFHIFERLHILKDYEGTGIGLAICKKIVERHGGRIWVESQPEEGSTFYFTIPAAG